MKRLGMKRLRMKRLGMRRLRMKRPRMKRLTTSCASATTGALGGGASPSDMLVCVGGVMQGRVGVTITAKVTGTEDKELFICECEAATREWSVLAT